MRKRTWTDEQLIEAVKNSVSISAVIRDLGLEINTGGNYCSIKNAVKRLGLNTSHWLGAGYLKGKTHNWSKRMPLGELLVVGRYTSTTNLKRRLIREGILKNECAECGKLPFWNGKPLVLVLDHINGVNNDNSLSNLRLLCPDCNSQQPTFCNGAEKIQRMKRDISVCSKCGKELKKKRRTGLCRLCFLIRANERRCKKNVVVDGWRNRPRENTRKVKRPSSEELDILLQTMPVIGIGKKYGVSDNAVRKWARSYGLTR